MSNKRKRKSSKKKENDNLKKIESVGGLDGDLSYIIRVVSIIVIVFCLFYGLTVLITKNGSTTTKKQNQVTDDAISYTEILLGRSFLMPEEEYLVLYYDKSNTELISSFSPAISTYRENKENDTLYTVDMSNKLNSSYISENSNSNPTDANELSINGPTLIRFSKGIVKDYIEGEEKILNYIK